MKFFNIILCSTILSPIANASGNGGVWDRVNEIKVLVDSDSLMKFKSGLPVSITQLLGNDSINDTSQSVDFHSIKNSDFFETIVIESANTVSEYDIGSSSETSINWKNLKVKFENKAELNFDEVINRAFDIENSDY